jgi:hypothetical protein
MMFRSFLMVLGCLLMVLGSLKVVVRGLLRVFHGVLTDVVMHYPDAGSD